MNLIRIALIFLLLLPGSCSSVDPVKRGFERRKLTSGEIEREYLLYQPANPENKKLPVVIALHGAASGADLMSAALGYRFADLADRDQVILVLPQGIDKSWNDGRGDQYYGSTAKNIDDLKFLNDLIADLEIKANIDSKQIFMLGSSNGGFMTFYYACQFPQKLKAIGTIISGMAPIIKENCNINDRVGLVMINGTADPLVKFDGGELLVGRKNHGKILPANETIRYWVEKSKCNLKPQEETIEKGQERMFKKTYSDCRFKNDLQQYAIEGAGHGIPGSKQYLPEFVIGKMSAEFSGPDLVWEYFRKFMK